MVGIGRPPKGMDPTVYVLRDFDQIERSRLDEMLSRAAEAVTVMLFGRVADSNESVSEKS